MKMRITIEYDMDVPDDCDALVALMEEIQSWKKGSVDLGDVLTARDKVIFEGINDNGILLRRITVE
jgi:hypothetical protein